jgi:acyl-homoserine lactone acylase PvdQ
MEQWSILRQNLSQMSGLSRLVAGRLAKAKGPTAQLAVRRHSWMGAKAIPSAWRGPTAQLAVEEYYLE